MTLRLAALYGHDPSTLHAAAEVLWLRGVYPDLDAAEGGYGRSPSSRCRHRARASAQALWAIRPGATLCTPPC